MKIVIAFPPGGPVDFVARILAEGLGKELGTTVIVENRAGANGGISAQAVAKSAPDGTTLWLTSAGAAVMNPALYDNLTYDMQRDFTPVSLVVNNVEVLVVNPANPANSVAELVVLSKQKQGPGADRVVRHRQHAASRDGAPRRFEQGEPDARAIQGCRACDHRRHGRSGERLLRRHSRTDRLHPWRKAEAARHRGAGAASAAARSCRTLDEQGIRGVESNNWYALFAPAKTPPARIEQLNAAVRRVLTTESYRSRLQDSGADPMPTTPGELGDARPRRYCEMGPHHSR